MTLDTILWAVNGISAALMIGTIAGQAVRIHHLLHANAQLRALVHADVVVPPELYAATLDTPPNAARREIDARRTWQ